MTDEIKICEQDVAALLKVKISQLTNSELESAALIRTISELQAEIAELKGEADATG